MNNDIAVVRDLKRRVSVATALEEAWRFEEADQIWAEMEKIADEQMGMTKTAQAAGAAAKGIKALLPWLAKTFKSLRPTVRNRKIINKGLEGLTRGPERAQAREILKKTKPGFFQGKNVDVGNGKNVFLPSTMATHAPAVGGAGVLGAGALGIGAYNAGKGSGARSEQRKMQESIQSLIPGMGGAGGGSYRTYPGGGGGGAMLGGMDSSSASDLDARIRRLEEKVSQMESSLMRPSSSPTPSTPSASTTMAGPPKEA